jgi:hypothetical protein
MIKIINEYTVNGALAQSAALANRYSAELLFAGFRVTAQRHDRVTLGNEWYSITIGADKATFTKRDSISRQPHSNVCAIIEHVLSIIDYGTHYVYVGGLAICPLQKFGEFNTADKLRDLFNQLVQGRAELQCRSDKAFRWRLSNGTELTIEQSSFEGALQQQEETTMSNTPWLSNDNIDIFSLVAASELFEVKVKFTNSAQEYSYKSEVEYAEGDRVVVDTPNSGLQAVKVISCSKGLAGGDFPKYKWIVAKVDTSRYEELLANEQTAVKRIEAAKRADKVKRELEALGVTKDEILTMLGLASKTDSQ